MIGNLSPLLLICMMLFGCTTSTPPALSGDTELQAARILLRHEKWRMDGVMPPASWPEPDSVRRLDNRTWVADIDSSVLPGGYPEHLIVEVSAAHGHIGRKPHGTGVESVEADTISESPPPAIELAAGGHANETVVFDDGIGAKVDFRLPSRGTHLGRTVYFTTYRISASKDDRLVLLTDLPGRMTDDGKWFEGSIIIPSELVSSAEIIALGSFANSSMGLNQRLLVREFRRISRQKSWTDRD